VTKIEKQIIIARPKEDVLRFATAWRNIPRYLDYIEDVRPLTEQTEGVGARLLVNLTFLGRKMTSEWETVEYNAGEGWTFKAPLMGVEARKRWRFESADEPAGGSTRVSFALEYQPKPAVIGPMTDAIVLRRRWDQIYERGLQNLKRVVESEPVD
jgi:uncharacterized membrane protein